MQRSLLLFTIEFTGMNSVMKKTFITLLALFGVAGAYASTVVTVANQNADLPPITIPANTLVWNLGAAQSGVYTQTYTLDNGDQIAYTIPGGRIFSDYASSGSWSNDVALDEMNATLGTSITTAQINGLCHTYTGWANSETTVELTLSSMEVGDEVVVYTLASNNFAALDNLDVSGLADISMSYATDTGSGFVSTATFSDSVNDWTLVKITGKVQDSKTVTFTSSSPKYGYGMFAYSKSVPEPATAALGLLAFAGLAVRRRRK